MVVVGVVGHIYTQTATLAIGQDGALHISGFDSAALTSARVVGASARVRSSDRGLAAADHYTPPELRLGLPHLCDRVDAWSLAVIILELLTGRPPFQRGSSSVHLPPNLLAIYRKHHEEQQLQHQTRLPIALTKVESAGPAVPVDTTSARTAPAPGDAAAESHPSVLSIELALTATDDLDLIWQAESRVPSPPTPAEVAEALWLRCVWSRDASARDTPDIPQRPTRRCFDLLGHLLRWAPAARANVSMAMRHSWLATHQALDERPAKAAVLELCSAPFPALVSRRAPRRTRARAAEGAFNADSDDDDLADDQPILGGHDDGDEEDGHLHDDEDAPASSASSSVLTAPLSAISRDASTSSSAKSSVLARGALMHSSHPHPYPRPAESTRSSLSVAALTSSVTHASSDSGAVLRAALARIPHHRIVAEPELVAAPAARAVFDAWCEIPGSAAMAASLVGACVGVSLPHALHVRDARGYGAIVVPIIRQCAVARGAAADAAAAAAALAPTPSGDEDEAVVRSIVLIRFFIAPTGRALTTAAPVTSGVGSEASGDDVGASLSGTDGSEEDRTVVGVHHLDGDLPLSVRAAAAIVQAVAARERWRSFDGCTPITCTPVPSIFCLDLSKLLPAGLLVRAPGASGISTAAAAALTLPC